MRPRISIRESVRPFVGHARQKPGKLILLGADKMGHYRLEVHFIKQQFFKQNDHNTLTFGGPTLRSNHRSHFPWYRGVEVEEVGRGEGTPVELVISA